MMFVDASAIVAIIARESDASALATLLGQAAEVHTSAIAIYEAVLGLARARHLSIDDAETLIDRFLEEIGARTVPITAKIGRDAIRAFERYGKGRHRANLNLGDCFSYACARDLDVPLLFKGGDFSHTDIDIA